MLSPDDYPSSLSSSSSVAALSLFPFNTRFQNAVLASADAQITAANEIIELRNSELRAALDSKQDLAIELSRAQAEAKKERAAAASATAELESLRSERLNWFTERGGYDNQVRLLLDELNGKRLLVQELMGKMTASNEERADLKAVTRALNESLKSHQTMEENLLGQLRSREAKEKQWENKWNEEKREKERLAIEKVNLLSKVDKLEEESKLHLSECSGARREAESERALGRIKDKQIRELMNVLESRETVVRKLEDRVKKMESESRERLGSNGASLEQREKEWKQRSNEFEERIVDLEKERDQWLNNERVFRDEMKQVVDQLALMNQELGMYRESEKKQSRELDQVKRDNAVLEMKLKEKNSQLKAEREKIHGFMEESEAEKREYRNNAERREQELEGRIKELERESAALGNVKQGKLNENYGLKRELKELEEQNASLRVLVNENQSKEADERVAKDGMERQLIELRYKNGRLETELEEVKRANAALILQERRKVEHQIGELKDELSDKQREIAELNSVFLSTQEKVLEAKREHEKVRESIKRLVEELNQLKWSKNMFQSENSRLLSEQKEIQLENVETSLKLYRKGKILAKSQMNQIGLEKQVEDSHMAIKELQGKYESEIASLKRRLQLAGEENGNFGKSFGQSVQDQQLLGRRIARLESELKSAKEENQRLLTANQQLNGELKALKKDSKLSHRQIQAFNEIQVENSFRMQQIASEQRNRAKAATLGAAPASRTEREKEKFKLSAHELSHSNPLLQMQIQSARLPAISPSSTSIASTLTTSSSRASSFESPLLSSVRTELHSAQHLAAARLTELMKLKSESHRMELNERANLDSLQSLQSELHEARTELNGQRFQVQLLQRENERLLDFCLTFEQQLKAARVKVEYKSRKYPRDMSEKLRETILQNNHRDE